MCYKLPGPDHSHLLLQKTMVNKYLKVMFTISRYNFLDKRYVFTSGDKQDKSIYFNVKAWLIWSLAFA